MKCFCIAWEGLLVSGKLHQIKNAHEIQEQPLGVRSRTHCSHIPGRSLLSLAHNKVFSELNSICSLSSLQQHLLLFHFDFCIFLCLSNTFTRKFLECVCLLLYCDTSVLTAITEYHSTLDLDSRCLSHTSAGWRAVFGFVFFCFF